MPHGVAVAFNRIIAPVTRKPFCCNLSFLVRLHEIEQLYAAPNMSLQPGAYFQKVQWLIPASPVIACFFNRRIDEENLVFGSDVSR